MANESASAASPKPVSGKATIKSGVRVHEIDSGKTVREVRKEWEQLFRIPSEAKAFSGTQELSEDDVVKEGMTIEYVRKSGEKGLF